MEGIFFLVRLVFFPIAILVLLGIGAFALLLVVGLSPIIVFVLLVALAIWLLLFLLAFLSAAFENKPDTISAFLRETGALVSEIFKETLLPPIKSYFKAYAGLCNWLINGSN